MVCNLNRPDTATIFADMEALFSSAVLGGAAIIPESNEFYVVSNDAALMSTFYSLGEQMWSEQDPRFACCDNLVSLAARDGVFPIPEQAAQGAVTLTGTATTAIPPALQFTIGGQTYAIRGVPPAEIGADGTAVVLIEAVVAGTFGNVTETTGTAINPPAGIDTVVNLACGSLSGGQAAEECEALRTRYLARLSAYPKTTFNTVRDEIIAQYPAVTRVLDRSECCEGVDPCGCIECTASLNLYVFMDNDYECGVPPDDCITEINQYLFGTNPGHGQGFLDIGICGAVQPVTVAQFQATLSGLCVTATQQNSIVEALTDYFRTVQPGGAVIDAQARVAIGQIAGDISDLVITWELTAGQTAEAQACARIDNVCNDIIIECDCVPCFTGATFADGNLDDGNCACPQPIGS